MLRDLINRPILKRSRACESCGSDFECQIGLKGCWCSEINLTDQSRQQVSESYKDCLCRKCLENAEARTE